MHAIPELLAKRISIQVEFHPSPIQKSPCSLLPGRQAVLGLPSSARWQPLFSTGKYHPLQSAHPQLGHANAESGQPPSAGMAMLVVHATSLKKTRLTIGLQVKTPALLTRQRISGGGGGDGDGGGGLGDGGLGDGGDSEGGSGEGEGDNGEGEGGGGLGEGGGGEGEGGGGLGDGGLGGGGLGEGAGGDGNGGGGLGGGEQGGGDDGDGGGGDGGGGEGEGGNGNGGGGLGGVSGGCCAHTVLEVAVHGVAS